MLEDFINSCAAERLRSGVFGDHVEELCGHLATLGYSPATIRSQLWTVSSLARWIADRGRAVTDLDEACVAEFVDTYRTGGRGCRGWRRTGLRLLHQLRSVGVIKSPEIRGDESPLANLLAQYEVYLRQERAITEGTVSEYVKIARRFLSEGLHGAGGCIESLSACHVRDFQLSQAREVAPSERNTSVVRSVRFYDSSSRTERLVRI